MAVEQLFVSVIIILVAARVLGEVFQRIKQPPLVGELLAGVIIGPSLLGIVLPTPDLQVLSDLAVFFLMFLTGLEMKIQEVKKAGLSAIVISVIAFFTPLLSGYFTSLYFGLTDIQSLFMGLLLSITAVPVSAIVLMQFGILNTKLGNTVMTAAVINDIMSLIVLSILLQIHSSDGSSGLNIGALVSSGFLIAIFLGGIFAFDFLARKTIHRLPGIFEPLFKNLRTKEAAFGILLITTIAVSLIAQNIGLHFVIGTFFAGLIVFKELIGIQNFDRVFDIISAITFGFFAPLFFVLIGIEFAASSLINAIPLFLMLLGVAMATKIGGGFLGARLVKFSNDTSLAIGFLMNGRGMVELVIASIGFAAGIIDQTLFSIAVAIGFVTTVVAPITSRPFVSKAKAAGSAAVVVDEHDTQEKER